MNISDDGLSLIKRFEGCRLTSYQDSVGIWTVGYGHTGSLVTKGMAITQQEADDLLRHDAKAAERCVSSLVSVELTQHEFDALCSFVFNVGCGNFRNSTMLKRLNAGDHDAAAQEFKRWDKAGGEVLAGLTKRREAEAQLFETA